jgi:hypothetical protein
MFAFGGKADIAAPQLLVKASAIRGPAAVPIPYLAAGPGPCFGDRGGLDVKDLEGIIGSAMIAAL